MTNYRALDPAKIVQTIERLHQRIEERFPKAGLGKVCLAVAETATVGAARAAAIKQPNLRLRFLSLLVLACGLAALGVLAFKLNYGPGADSAYTVLQGVDSGFNIIVLFGAAMLGLMRYEGQLKRTRALKDLHELRSLIHIIDMHQLTKDPSAVASGGVHTAHSPDRHMTPFELTRYLDYSSELLSLTSKVAALYAQSSGDNVVISTVNDLEQLSANLSEKIWQKIALVRQDMDTPAANPKPVLPAAPVPARNPAA
jgi:hypothetical protein